MDIKLGDKIKYFFPEPADNNNKSITGIVETISDYYVFLLTDNAVRIKISFKNFNLMHPYTSDELAVEKSLSL